MITILIKNQMNLSQAREEDAFLTNIRPMTVDRNQSSSTLHFDICKEILRIKVDTSGIKI